MFQKPLQAVKLYYLYQLNYAVSAFFNICSCIVRGRLLFSCGFFFFLFFLVENKNIDRWLFNGNQAFSCVGFLVLARSRDTSNTSVVHFKADDIISFSFVLFFSFMRLIPRFYLCHFWFPNISQSRLWAFVTIRLYS